MPTAEQLGIDTLEVIQNVYRLEGTVRGGWFDCLCPFHNDTHSSCGINLKSGGYHCFSCGAKGDIVKLGEKLIAKPRNEIERIIKSGSPDALVASVKRKSEALQRIQRRVLPESVPEANLHDPERYHDGPMSYMRQRGFTNETCKRWGLRYVREAELLSKEKPFTVTYSIGIPIRDVNQRLVAWIYRRTPSSAEWQPKEIATPGFQKSDNLFGINMAEPQTDVAIVEGALDAMFLDQCGIPALALLGSEPGNPLRLRYLTNFSSVTLFLDRDLAGRRAIGRVGEQIRKLGIPIYVVRYPANVEGKDPPELGSEAAKRAFERAMPYETWRLTRFSR